MYLKGRLAGRNELKSNILWMEFRAASLGYFRQLECPVYNAPDEDADLRIRCDARHHF